MNLENKIAVITGASRGLGKGMAFALAASTTSERSSPRAARGITGCERTGSASSSTW